MDAFVRTLSITPNQSVDNVKDQCARLINWLHYIENDVGARSDIFCDPNNREIETMFKATLYLHECFSIYGEKLLTKMVSDNVWARERLEAYYVAHNKNVCMRNLSRKILSFPGNRDRQIVVSEWLQAFIDIEPRWRECISTELVVQSSTNIADNFTASSSQNDEVGNLLRMLQLAQHTFQLPAVQIQTAVERMLIHLPFSILGQLFQVTPKCPLYTRCLVLAELVCQELVASEDFPTANQRQTMPSTCFIETLCQYIGGGGQCNVLFFWQCLGHQSFAHSLIKYLLVFYAKHIEHVDHDWLQYTATAMNSNNQLIPLASILLLTHVLLATKSPCRQQFYALIKDTKYSGALMALLNKVAFVYR